MKLSRWCRGDDAGAEQSHRIFDRKELARFSLQSNDRLHLTEVWLKDRCLFLADLILAQRWKRAGNADARAGYVKKDVKPLKIRLEASEKFCS